MFLVNVDNDGTNYGYRISLNNSQGRFFFLAQKGCDYSRDSDYLIIFDKVLIPNAPMKALPWSFLNFSEQKDKKGVLILMKSLFSERKALMLKFATWNCCCLTRANK